MIYEEFRESMRGGPEVATELLVSWAQLETGDVAAAVTCAALDVPLDCAAELLVSDRDEINTLIDLFTLRISVACKGHLARCNDDAKA